MGHFTALQKSKSGVMIHIGRAAASAGCEAAWFHGMFGVFFFFPFIGIAFPTSISVNNCVCHFSPLKSDQDYILKDGDLVKM